MPGEAVPSRLDPASRLALDAALTRLMLPLALVVFPWLTHAWTLSQAANVLSFWFAVNGAVTMAVALLHREPMPGPVLNRWDEGLAFAAASRLADMIHLATV